MNKVAIWVDGACVPNPGNGGVGIVLIAGEHRKEVAVFIGQSTNNIAEIVAARMALNMLKYPCEVDLYSDSQYVVKTMNGEYTMSKNLESWKLLQEAASRHVVRWHWVKGHSGVTENEIANRLAEKATKGGNYEAID